MFLSTLRRTRRSPCLNSYRYQARVEWLETRLVPASLAVGSGAGNRPEIRVFDAGTSNLTARFDAFNPQFLGGVQVAVGDVNDDGVPDIIAAAGPGGGPHVKVIDGTKLGMVDANGEIEDAALLASFYAYDPGFGGGVSVAFNQISPGTIGSPILITGAGAGGGPHVKVIDGTKLADLQSNSEIADSALTGQFYAYSPFFAGGVQVAAADLNGDGVVDIVTGAGSGGGPHVKAIDGTKLSQVQADGEISDGALIGQFYAYSPDFNGGVSVAAQALNGLARIATGAGAGNIGPRVRVIDAAQLGVLNNDSEPTGAALLGDFFGYDPAFTGGVRVAAGKLNGDDVTDLLIGQGPGGSQVKAIDGTKLGDLQPNQEIAESALLDNFAAFPGFNGGVFVGTDAVPPLSAQAAAFARTITDLYVFRSPANANNTVFVLDFQPFPGNVSRTVADPSQVYEIHIDSNSPHDGVADFNFRITFSVPDAQGQQRVTLSSGTSASPPTGIIAQGLTGVNIPISGGGMFRSGIQDEPFFFDQGAFNTFLNTGTGFPRPVGQAHNFFGPNGNTFSAILEIPSAQIPTPASNPNKVLGVWATISKNGVQVARMGRPLIDLAVIPPVPHTQFAQGDLHDEFVTGSPASDRTNLRNGVIAVLTDPNGLYKRSQADASFLADALLPDMLFFQIGNPGGFGTLVGSGEGPFAGGQVLGNGRQFRDDVVDIFFNFMTNGAIPSDNVGDDNGLKITDGSVDPVSGMTRAIAFPYIGAENLPLNGPGTGPNP